MRNAVLCLVMRAISSFSRCSLLSAAMAALFGGLSDASSSVVKGRENSSGKRMCSAETTSTAPKASFAVLHFVTPSAAAPTISSRYFSRLRAPISFVSVCTASAALSAVRNRLMKAVCRFSEVS